MTSWFAASAEGWDPRAHPSAVVAVGNARFTVLTPRLLRLEWRADGRWEDRASLTVVNRRLPVPDFEVEELSDGLRIETEQLVLRYRAPSEGSTAARRGFTPESLEISLPGPGGQRLWGPGDTPSGNLGGTARTLDAVDGAVAVGPGVLSRDGWALLDDSASPLFVDGDPRRVEGRPGGSPADWYFFGHGVDHVGALADFAAVAGRIPLPPRWAFGVWWSRYWAYTDDELRSLAEAFREEEVPLDVLVVDMDWHETFDLDWDNPVRDAAGQLKGWTGYSWSRERFPDPEGFLAWAHGEGLKVPLNLHPASGIQPWEDAYPAVARALGVDPATEAYIPFRAEDPDFAQAYFRHVIHPLEEQGVDFWWLDWQQWSETEVPGLNPTIWLNHLFFTDMEARERGRPIILHRFGGVGSHRYQVGFSGDAHSTWESLAFQPRFTATASNVLFGYWSHDIGGHEPGPVEPELYARWVQFGVFSPIFRTHATKHPEAERRLWAFGSPYREAMLDAVRLRMALLPYIYAAARTAYDTGVSLVRPLYYAWPEVEEAYRHQDQYLFGPDILVHPVTEAGDPATGVVSRRSWLPPGRWVAWDPWAPDASGPEILEGPLTVERQYSVGEMPLFVRAGAVLPMATPALRAREAAMGPLVLTVFPGADGDTRLYEDAGDDSGYRRGAYVWTSVHTEWSEDGRRVEVRVGPRRGAYPGMLPEREIRVRLVHPDGVELRVEGLEGVRLLS